MGKIKVKPKFYELTVKDIRRETLEAVSVVFDIPHDLKTHYVFLPGQHLTLRTVVDGEDIRRSYSLCSAPSDNEWRVAVKQVEQGTFSTFVNTDLKCGDRLQVMTPVGNFQAHVNAQAKKKYVFFAAGSGITPIISIIKEVLRNEPNSNITLFYGNKNFSSVIFREELEGLKNKYMSRLQIIHVFSRENLGNEWQKGRIDSQKCKQLYNIFLKGQSISEVFVCGPEEMITSVKETLQNLGIEKEKIHSELFTPSDNIVRKKVEYKGPKVESNVQVIFDGIIYNIPLNSSDEVLLDAVRNAGADVPFSCKGGVCSTCKAKVIEGQVRMDVNYALEADELERGYILACQAHPVSEKLVVSFDE